MSKGKIRIIIVGSCLIVLVLWILSCATNPVTGKKELMLLSETDEINLGRETDGQVVKQYGIYEDPKLTAYLNGICERLGKISHRPQLTYHFRIVDATVVNAFAVPGGHVYFTRGILASLNNFKELSDPKRINVKPDRIRIRATKTSDTLENELRSLGARMRN